jgi:adenosylcobinamide hydrolase
MPEGDGSERDGFRVRRRAEVLQVTRPETRWLSTGANGGFSAALAAYNISVPSGWGQKDLAAYAEQRRDGVGFGREGPSLLTGVSMDHARVARSGPATVVATAGVSNPAVFGDRSGSERSVAGQASKRGGPTDSMDRSDGPVGTVNLIACVERALPPGAQANLVAVVAEAKTAALLAETGFPGTTTDAVVVGTARDRPAATFSGSATEVGAATRAAVYDAVRASLHSRYPERDYPEFESAEHGVVTERATTVFAPEAEKNQADGDPPER